MNPAERSSLVVATADLLPDAWRHVGADGPVRTFNPGLLADENGWLFAYRVVGSDGRRRIGLCRLDAGFRVVPGSPLPFSDRVRFRPDATHVEATTQWFADPRLYRLGGRLYLYWNSGWHEPRNWQFLQELDPTSLLPRGHPRELVLAGERQKLEKNWTLFESGTGDGGIFAVYSITPHRILQVTLEGDEEVRCADYARQEWSIDGYPKCHGGLRGGAPPCHLNGEYWTICHSVHDSPAGYQYQAAAYRFAGRAPFAPTAKPVEILGLPNPAGDGRTYARLNPAVGEVIYPCGAAWDGARWIISHGINDENCGLAFLDYATVARTLASVRPPAGADAAVHAG